MRFLLRLIIDAAAFWVAAWLVPGIYIGPETVNPDTQNFATVATFLFVGLVFGVVNAILGGLVKFLSMPLTCLTLGLFTFVINAFLFWVTSVISSIFPVDFIIDSFFWDAILGALIVTIISAILNSILVKRGDRSS
ncbi:phage holin family protein [Galactobacter sp.]|uniref:phage holin family protein n=1 Tax=Galactobacter sp. TaxID=2676125 RepID=UPI0025BD9983|nr:phage holin family protein [Galactobacter sp.]